MVCCVVLIYGYMALQTNILILEKLSLNATTEHCSTYGAAQSTLVLRRLLCQISRRSSRTPLGLLVDVISLVWREVSKSAHQVRD